ncbi:MAG: hemolysin III family protein [Trueperaceae bacterium]|nr:hemolysin III family protein [Trueperaceae bacterium]
MTAKANSTHWLFKLFREPANSLSHFIGILLSIAALVILLVFSKGDPWRVTSFAIYGSSLIILYTASTLYHSLKVGERVLKALKRFDHMAIFGLIAGTYTPVTLVTLQGGKTAWGWSIFGVIWGFALLGFLFKIFWIRAPRWLYTTLYVVMGWMAIIAIVPIAQTMPFGGLMWLGIGGVFYTLGAVIYALKKPNLHKYFGFHEIWHLFVLAGSISHFVMMLKYVLPSS